MYKNINTSSNLIYCSLLLIYFLDQTLQIYVHRVAGIIIFLALNYYFFKKTNEKVNNLLFLFIVLFIAYNIISFWVNIDYCNDYKRIIYSSILFFFILYTSINSNFDYLDNVNFLKIFTYFLSLFIILDFASNYFNLNFRFFLEPSHVALYISPFLFLAFRKNIMLIPNSINLIYIFYFHTSLTLLIIFALFIFFNNVMKLNFNIRKSNLAIIICFIAIILFINIENPIIIKLINSADTIINVAYSAQIDLDKPYTMSIAVWLNGLSNIFIYLKQTFFLGTGFNLMGCQDYLYNGYFNYLFSVYGSHEVYNPNDGSFNLSKIIAENGILGIIILSIVINKMFKNFFIQKSDLIFVGSIVLFAFLFIRGLNYFSIPFVISLIFLLKQNSNINKN